MHSQAPVLTSLNLSRSRLSDVGASQLARSLQACSSLRDVVIRDCAVQDAALASFARLLQSVPVLHTLDLSGNTVGSRSCQVLEQCLRGASHLQSLRLDRCGIGDQEGAALAAALCGQHSWQLCSLAGTSVRHILASLNAVWPEAFSMPQPQQPSRFMRL